MSAPNDAARVLEGVLAEGFASGREFEIVTRTKLADGGQRSLNYRVAPVQAADGTVRWETTTAEGDAAEQTRVEKKLRDDARRFEEQMHVALRGSQFAIWEFDMPDGNLDTATSSFLNVWELIGHDPATAPSDFGAAISYESVRPDDRPAYEGSIRSFLAGTDEHFRTETPLRRKNGSIGFYLLRGVALRDAKGMAIRFTGVVIDISELKAVEAALHDARHAAEAANRAKDEFLANVSHEIRTPMNAIIGMTELTLDSPLTEHQRTLLKTVKSAADNLLVIINDLLDFSKIEAGKMELEAAPFSLRAIVGETMRFLAARAHRKGLELVSDVDSDLPDALVGDAGRLRQVLLNIAGNAIKFTEQGEVVVQIVADPNAKLEEDSATLRMTVRDTGIGISPETQSRIFRAFEQEDTSTTRRFGGTGLGLSIASHLVTLMNGNITVESEPGHGSTFGINVRFALQPNALEKRVVAPLAVLRNLRVLVVDDNPTNRHILEEWLRGWQMRPHAVGDGLSAMGALWDASSSDPFSLILLDSRMPDTDGWSLAARIRERAALAPVRIIMLASADRPGDPSCSRELGIDAHLLKPALQEELLDTMYRVMGNDGAASRPTLGAEQSTTNTTVAPENPLNVLVAEDNELSAQLMAELLTGRGHRMRIATNGRDAAALATSNAFDILFLDLHMPMMDGFEVTRLIRENERTTATRLPIVALTARSRKQDHDRCLASGMDDFLTKPIRSKELVAVLERLTTKK